MRCAVAARVSATRSTSVADSMRMLPVSMKEETAAGRGTHGTDPVPMLTRTSSGVPGQSSWASCSATRAGLLMVTAPSWKRSAPHSKPSR